MKFTLMDVRVSDEILSGSNITMLVVVAIIAIAAITAVFIWRKKKNKKQ
jgi:LPXTG-motif cell wall-anchored protein